jgi:hypothetical protein
MDETRKKTLWVCATILAAPKLADLQDGDPKKAALQTDITLDAITKAERIIRQIDARWPSNPIPGKDGSRPIEKTAAQSVP